MGTTQHSLRTVEVDVAILGVGTAALAAASEVRKTTKNFILISNGVYGTTCVRAGCMPSKVFIHAAQLYHARHHMETCGIRGAEQLTLDRTALLEHVRQMRLHFLEHTLKLTGNFRDHIVEGRAWFHSCNEIEVGATLYRAKRVVIASGSSPIIPPECKQLGERMITSDTLFDLEDLPARLGVMGLSVLGTEMAQAFARLGIEVTAADNVNLIGGLTDPDVSAVAVEVLSNEFRLCLDTMPQPAARGDAISFAGEDVDRVFIAMSRQANLGDMGLEQCAVVSPGEPVVHYDPSTMQVGDLPVFVAGDVKLGRSILHESNDEGRIAGHNAARGERRRFPRRTPMQITYTSPVIAIVGKAWAELQGQSVIVGEARFEDQGRAKIMGQAQGIVRIYAQKEGGKLEGAEMFAPGGEHLAHLLAWLIDRNTTVKEALALPFYHPTLEEGLRTALIHAEGKLA